MSSSPKVVIAGGGLTGIGTALHLQRPWVIYEREARLGGTARTEQRDGYSFDQTGHWLHLRDPAMKALIAQALPGQMETVERVARIHSNGVTTRYPFQANLFGLPPEVIKECLLGVIEAVMAQRVAGSSPEGGRVAGGMAPRNFEEYCLRHFGEGISRHFMIPYNSKLWGVHPREITAAWCSRFVPLPNLEQVVAGAVGAGPAELGYNISFSYPRRGGIESVVRALAGRLQGGEAHCGVEVERIDHVRREVVAGGETVPYSALVSTMPLPELLRRMPGLPAGIERHASRLRCTSLRYLDVATRTRAPAGWHWAYVPEARFPFYRVGIYSNAVASMAPPGGSSYYVELADRGAPGAAEIRAAVAGLVEIGAISDAADVVFAQPRHIDYAYVVFDDSYYEATAAIFRFLEQHGIHSRGRYGAWTYNAMEDCLLQGREVAATIESATRIPQP